MLRYQPHKMLIINLSTYDMLKAILQHRNTAGVCKFQKSLLQVCIRACTHIHKSNYIDAGTNTDLDTDY